MPEMHNPEKDGGNRQKRKFINEKVVKPALTRRQIAKRVLVCFLAALVLGGAAGVSFAVARPLAERYLVERPEETTPISIPRDEQEETTMAETPEETTAAETESEPIEDQVQTAIENYRYTIADVNSLVGSLRQQVLEADKGIVVVHSVQQETDWFDNPVETTGLYAGLVIAHTEQELLILTPEAAVEHADSIKVTFGDSYEADGRMKQKDGTSGLAIVSVNTADIDEKVKVEIRAIPLGNSYTMREGDMIIAVGGPAGVVHSVDYGFISYINRNAQAVDQRCRVLYSGILKDTMRGTFYLNSAGEMIGWAMSPDSEAETTQEQGVTRIMGISDYKSILEKLSNGLGAPSLGIVGQAVEEAAAGEGMPEGIYVVNVITDGPAYNAGIQNGDIIVEANGRELPTMKDFQTMVEGLECGQLINVTVARNGREEFAQLEFQVTVGVR